MIFDSIGGSFDWHVHIIDCQYSGKLLDHRSALLLADNLLINVNETVLIPIYYQCIIYRYNRTGDDFVVPNLVASVLTNARRAILNAVEMELDGLDEKQL